MFRIISDSACDLSDEYVAGHDISLVPFYVTFDGEQYHKERVEVDRYDFYSRMVNEGSFPKSSLPSVQDFMDAFLPHVQAGTPILCTTITTSFSGSYNSAMTARDELLEQYPDAVITVMNTTANTASEALFVNEAVRMRDAGMSYEDTIATLEKLKSSTHIFFTIESLDYLKKNGRIGKLASLLTNTLSIKPLIVMKNGEIGIGGICRTRKKAKKAVIDLAKKYFSEEGHNIEDYNLCVGWGYDDEEAKEYQKEVEEALGITINAELNVKIGVTVACHTGPYALGMACVRKYESVL